jgi:hypothetical protein
MKISRPSIRKTRFISSSAREAFGIEHNVQVIMTVSTLESARGSRSSALWVKNSITGNPDFTLPRAIRCNSADGSTPYTR